MGGFGPGARVRSLFLKTKRLAAELVFDKVKELDPAEDLRDLANDAA